MNEKQKGIESRLGGAPTWTDQSMDLEQIARYRRHSLKSIEGIQEEDADGITPWDAVVDDKDERVVSDADSHRLSILMRESDTEQQVLKIAACLSSLDTRLLEASIRTKINVSQILSNAMIKGLILCDTNGNYVFASGSFQTALYRSISVQEKSRQHVAIARNLVRSLSQQELEEHYHTVLRQFHLGRESTTDQSERYSIAALCLQAAELAVPKGNFRSASRYLEFGLSLFGKDCWKDEYELSLALYNASAEIEYSKSNFEQVELLVQTVLENARCFRDTLRARASHIYALSSQYKMPQAVEESLAVLDELGEPLPAKPNKLQVLIEFMRTRRALRGKTNEMILRMPFMMDSDKLAVCQILNLMFPSAFRTRPSLFPLVVLRLVHLTVKYGLSAVSAVGFAYYGPILCAISGNIDDGYRYCQLALALLDKFQAREWIPRVYLGCYGHAGSYKLPLQEMYPHLECAQHIALETGDTEYASNISNILCAYIQLSGDSLDLFEKTALEFYENDLFKKHDTAMLMMETSFQLIRSLKGSSMKEPPLLSGNFLVDEADILARASKAGDDVAVGFLHFFSLLIAYVFNDYEDAVAETKGMSHLFEPPYLHPAMSCPYTFHALALLAVCKNRRGWDRRRILLTARRSIKKLEQFSKHTPENCLGKLYLLQAELAAVKEKKEDARCMYASAAGVFSEVNDKMMYAIACERAGRYLRGIGDETASTRYFRKAYSGYIDWGATAKVEQLKMKMPDSFP